MLKKLKIIAFILEKLPNPQNRWFQVLQILPVFQMFLMNLISFMKNIQRILYRKFQMDPIK